MSSRRKFYWLSQKTRSYSVPDQCIINGWLIVASCNKHVIYWSVIIIHIINHANCYVHVCCSLAILSYLILDGSILTTVDSQLRCANRAVGLRGLGCTSREGAGCWTADIGETAGGARGLRNKEVRSCVCIMRDLRRYFVGLDGLDWLVIWANVTVYGDT
jgi:hypothetical protein